MLESGESQYQKIVEICRKSQAKMQARTAEVGIVKALPELEPYESMWNNYFKKIKKPVSLSNADFSGLLFSHAHFTGHRFLDCNFSGSRWVFSVIASGSCAGSNFSGITSVLWPFRNTDCTHCNFTEAEIAFCDLCDKSNNFENADFTNAKLTSSHSFFKNQKPPAKTKFKNAVMDGCKLTIKPEDQPEHNTTKAEIQSILEKIFSPEQLSAMQINYGTSGCFIATAACGIESEEVTTLRHFRDTVLLSSTLGRLFVRAYYRLSPSIASLIAGSPKARCVVRKLLVRPWAKLAGCIAQRRHGGRVSSAR